MAKRNRQQNNTNVENIKEYINATYGESHKEWQLQLMLLQDTINRYQAVKECIDVNGIYDPETNVKNPLLSTEKDLMATILKLSQKLGISPYDAAKIKSVDADSTEDYIEQLING